MTKHILLACLLATFTIITANAQIVDTAAEKIAGQWQIEKVVVRETLYSSHAFLKEYSLTDRSEIEKIRAGLPTEILFGGYRYNTTRGGRLEAGEFSWVGRNMILLSRTEPADEWRFIYEWEMPSMNMLIFKKPFAVYRDTVSGQLVRADYISHYSRKPKNQ